MNKVNQATSRDIVTALFRLGRGTSFAKIDWTSGTH